MGKVLPQPGLLNKGPPIGRLLKVGLQFGGLLKEDSPAGGLSLGKGISKGDSPIEGQFDPRVPSWLFNHQSRSSAENI